MKGSDLEKTLRGFWLAMMRDAGASIDARIKASELLAKYFLQAQKAKGKLGTVLPSTAKIFGIVDQLEQGDGSARRD